MRAKEFIVEADSYSPPTLNVGDRILKGKFKNSPAEIKGFTRDKHNQPVLKTDRGDVQLFKPRVAKLMDNGVSEGGPETTWSDDTDTITLQDILELTKHIKQINLPINDNLKSKLLHWEGNPEEIERVNQVTVSNQFPILIMVDKQGQIEWILDGNHRLHKAIQSQAKTIPAKLIKPSDLNDKAKKIFNIKKQGVAENFADGRGPGRPGKQAVSEESEQDYLSQIPDLAWKPVNRTTWNTIQDEGLDQEQNAPEHTDWAMASLLITTKDAQALQALDDAAIEDFNRFDIHLKSRYPGLTDLINYDTGTVTIVKPRTMAVSENFADGRGPGRPGDSQRHGIPKGATMAQLEKAARAPGRKGQLARWQLNMRRGKKK